MSTGLAVPFQRGLNLHDDGPAWCIDPEGQVYLRCQCGLLLGTLGHVAIAADGTVPQRVAHGRGEQDLRGVVCRWGTYVRLEGWQDGALPIGDPKIAPRALAAAPR